MLRWIRQPTSEGKHAHARTIASVPFNKVFIVQFSGATYGPMARLLKYPDRAGVVISDNGATERSGFGLLQLYATGMPYDVDMQTAFALDRAPFNGAKGDARIAQHSAEQIISDAEELPLDGLKE